MKRLGENLSGKNVVVIGRSILVGKPAALLFLPYGAWVAFATVLNAAIWWLN